MEKGRIIEEREGKSGGDQRETKAIFSLFNFAAFRFNGNERFVVNIGDEINQNKISNHFYDKWQSVLPNFLNDTKSPLFTLISFIPLARFVSLNNFSYFHRLTLRFYL